MRKGGDLMRKAIKIRLFPTKEQELLMLKSIGCSRFAYNWALGKCNERYKNNENYSISEIRKQFTQLWNINVDLMELNLFKRINFILHQKLVLAVVLLKRI